MLLEKELEKIRKFISEGDKIDPSVSQKGIYWQTDHILKAINGICTALQKSDPQMFRKKFNMKRFVIFTTGFIPRGKAKAPKLSMSEGEISQADLASQLKQAENHLSGLDNLPPDSYFFHPVFGELNVKLTKRMLTVHTRHHLKIIRDIQG